MANSSNAKNKIFKIITICWGTDLIDKIFDKIEKKIELEFVHIVLTSIHEKSVLKKNPNTNVIYLRNIHNDNLPPADIPFLRLLESGNEPTVKNVIMSDRVVSLLSPEKGLSYASYLGKKLIDILSTQKPNLVLGTFDSVHAGIGLMVCRHLGIPWVTTAFSTIPTGLMQFVTNLSLSSALPILREKNDLLYYQASETLMEFESRRMRVPSYKSAFTLRLILRRSPSHLKLLSENIARIFRNEHDPFNQYNLLHIIKNYLVKRKNLITLPKMLHEPPQQPFALYALHMQPESSIDVLAPYFSNQFCLLKQIVRAMPADLKLLVKLHISDADHYSRSELSELTSMPGVELVHPTANSRDFLEAASLVFGIQGTICLEAALLGKPVLMFGDSPYLEFPSVTKIGRITELSENITLSLNAGKPPRESIIEAFASYHSKFLVSVYNDWTQPLTDKNIVSLADCFMRLKSYHTEG